MTNLDSLLARFQNVKPSGSGYLACCPSHTDHVASLSISVGDEGKILFNCHAGCSFEAIVKALELRPADYMGWYSISSPNRLEHSNGSDFTIEEFSLSKRLPLDFLQRHGVSEYKYRGSRAVRFEYRDSNGSLFAVRFRVSRVGDRFRWRSGDKVAPYGLWKIQEAKTSGYITLCEGESDSLTLWAHGEPVLGLPGASTWQESWAEYLEGFPRIYVVIEPDKGGESVKKRLAKSAIRERVYLVSLGEHKDPSALYLADSEHFLERWRAALNGAIPFLTIEEAERHEVAAQAYILAENLLHDPRLLERIGQAIQARGYAGNLIPPKMAYLGITSRFLERPQNQAFVSQSGAGKSKTVDVAVEMHPEDAVYIEKAGSARALIYTEADFQHKTVIVAEADSIPEEGPAASAIRSLANDNSMEYDVVERNEKTNKFETRHIVKPGPMGLITTSTRSLKTQMGTRVLEISVPDDEQQTRAVMHAHARSVQPATETSIDLAPYIAVQQWLALVGCHKVAIPYADCLADLVSSREVRMRRDFRQLLTIIQTIALLYQCQRQKNAEGWIVATLDDYEQARMLLAPTFDTIVSEGITPAVRATVEAVKPDEEVTEADLTQRLGLAKSTISYRVKRALKGGWLVNKEVRRGHPAKLSRGTPLPEQQSSLPTVAQLKEAFDRSNDSNSNTSRTSFEQPGSEEKSEPYKEPFEGSNRIGREREHHHSQEGPLSEAEVF